MENKNPIDVKRSSMHARRCFMSGEYCAKQANVNQERRKLHEKGIINAFVIMNFSDMSDVVYKWRIRDYIKTLAGYFCVNPKTGDVKLFHKESEAEAFAKQKIGENEWKHVKEIDVTRADSNSATNYVVCDRVCQQMQIADLIVVDVTVENANVFYEFGLAVAMGKLILPMCYSESFYYMPDHMKMLPTEPKNYQKHIDCFPWRRRLFENFGLRFRRTESKVKYLPFAEVTTQEPNIEHVFGDKKYKLFPFDQEEIGTKIYEEISKSYNDLRTEKLNTMVVYTMDGFVKVQENAKNDDEAVKCIINYYTFMTSKVKSSHCFCGDRVVTLVQEDIVGEDNKDARIKYRLPYQIGDLVHIGVNQATYIAQRDKIVDSDFLKTKKKFESDTERDEAIRAVKKHIGNRSIMIPLNPPVYVDHAIHGLQKGIFKEEDNSSPGDNFCFFHIMLRTLKYANEIVVDISNNCVEALFWLGMAHGADVHAIAVRNDRAGREKEQTQEEQKERKVFDVAGLWTAVMKENNTEEFYRQLVLAQTGIEQRSKLMLTNADEYAEQMLDWLRGAAYLDNLSKKINDTLNDKKKDEEKKLESYYRNRLWGHLIQRNSLHLYMQQSGKKADGDQPEPKQLLVSKWDMDAISELSYYLSKRKVLSESIITALKDTQTHQRTNTSTEDSDTGTNQTTDSRTRHSNFISVGAYAKPCMSPDKKEYEPLGAHMNSILAGNNVGILNSSNHVEKTITCPNNQSIKYRGFKHERMHWYTFMPEPVCYKCMENTSDKNLGEDGNKPRNNEPEEKKCPFYNHAQEAKPEHTQMAQVLFWREENSEDEEYNYQMSLIGASGPATYALTYLFVDEFQKKNVIKNKDDENSKLLISLQRNIRESFMEEYRKALNDQVEEDNDQRKKVEMYLSTVLYRYFFPFLSKADEARIANGLFAYLTSLGVEEPTKEAIKKQMTDLLERFRGVEAMYMVTVQVESKQEDSRTVIKIEPWPSSADGNSTESNVACLFTKKVE